MLAATTLHLGFQLTVTTVVYPALASVDSQRWVASHEAHGKAITPVVALTYGLLLVACAISLVTMPTALGAWLAASGAALAMGSTAFVAAPTHGKLTAGPEPFLIRRLLMADRVRLLGALTAVGGAVAVAL